MKVLCKIFGHQFYGITFYQNSVPAFDDDGGPPPTAVCQRCMFWLRV